MTKDGIKLMEFSMPLLEKLEELTLYTLQQQRINDEQQSTLKALESNLSE